MKKSNIKNRLNTIYIYRLIAAYVHKLLVVINPLKEINRNYYDRFRKYPDIKNPKNLVEKTYWLQLNTDTSLWTLCADKYRMREYVRKCGLEGYLPEHLGHWDKAQEIDFNSLPNSFILKTNNGCGTCFIVKDKNSIDQKSIKKQMKKWMTIPYGYSGAQLHYTHIKPMVIAEELLTQDDVYEQISPGSMVDFKVWCINGIPESILITYNRQRDSHNVDLYDTDWIRKKDCINFNGKFNFSDTLVPKPKCLGEMLEMAKTLSRPFPEVRVDFYVVNGRPIIGELTFTAGYGNLTEAYYDELGAKINLDVYKK